MGGARPRSLSLPNEEAQKGNLPLSQTVDTFATCAVTGESGSAEPSRASRRWRQVRDRLGIVIASAPIHGRPRLRWIRLWSSSALVAWTLWMHSASISGASSRDPSVGKAAGDPSRPAGATATSSFRKLGGHFDSREARLASPRSPVSRKRKLSCCNGSGRGGRPTSVGSAILGGPASTTTAIPSSRTHRRLCQLPRFALRSRGSCSVAYALGSSHRMRNAQAFCVCVCMLALVPACASTHPVGYSGVSYAQKVSGQEVLQFESMPNGFERIGRVAASCDRPSTERPMESVAWLDAVCGRETLAIAINDRAASVGGTAVVALSCAERRHADGRATASCSGEVATAAIGRRAAGLRDDPSRRSLVAMLTTVIDITPASGAPRREAIDVREIREIPRASPPWRELAQIVARCTHCSREDAEGAVRGVVASFGGDAVGELNCVRHIRGWQCGGEAFAYQESIAPARVW